MRQATHTQSMQRQHRLFAMFAAIQAWKRNLDALILTRYHLNRIFDVTRFERSRLDALKSDLKSWFPFSLTFKLVKQGRLENIIISRCKLDDVPATYESIETMIKEIDPLVLRIGQLELWADPKLYLDQRTPSTFVKQFCPFFTFELDFDQRLLSSILTLLGTGEISLDELPKMTSDMFFTKPKTPA